MQQKELNQYMVSLEPIGKGVYGIVYLAYDKFKKRKVAIKELEDLERAIHEAYVMKQCGISKFLPTFYDFFENNGKAYIVMEHIEGETFGENFDSHSKKRDEKLSVQITINILKGLEVFHKTGFYHDDIKPKNVMIHNDDPETVKIIDFNSSKKIENVSLMKKDLSDAAQMCIFLINGTVPEPVDTAEIHNRKLKSILFKALDTDAGDNYNSLKEFISVLKEFR